MTRATLVSALLVPFFTFETAFAALDTIDADGVTERGGTPAQARMLTRTGADGKLDASLLPPEGAWALPPMSRLYFVDRYAPAGGDGSVKAPFQTITEAAGAVPSGSALFLSPGNYSGEVTLTAGRTLSLVGCGFLTRLSDVTVTAEGDSSSTVLALANLSAATLTINGGSTYVRAYSANISTLSGSATGVKIRRYDMGTRIGTLTLVPLENTYTGYDTVKYSEYLKGASSSKHLHMVGSRPTVGTETGAFLSDIQTATNAVYASLGEFRAADALLATSVATERTARLQGDAALGTALTNRADELEAEIAAIGGNWQTQLTALSQAIGTLSEGLSTVTVQETADVSRLEAADTAIRSEFAAADTSLHTTVQGEISDAVDGLEMRVPGVATTQAQNVLALARTGIITDANAAIRPEITTVANGVTALDTTVSGHTTTLSSHTSSISLITSKVNEIITFIKSKHSDCTISPL